MCLIYGETSEVWSPDSIIGEIAAEDDCKICMIFLIEQDTPIPLTPKLFT